MTIDRHLVPRRAERGGLVEVFDAIASLSDLDRTILELCVFEEYEPREAAELLGTSQAHIVRRIERTRRLLISAVAA